MRYTKYTSFNPYEVLMFEYNRSATCCALYKHNANMLLYSTLYEYERFNGLYNYCNWEV